MESIIGGLLVIGVIAFAIWRQKADQKKHGEITKKDRQRTYISILIWFSILITAFKLYPPSYLVILAVFLIYSQIFGMGLGRRGAFRQIRDGGFIACVASAPVCLILWLQNG